MSLFKAFSIEHRDYAVSLEVMAEGLGIPLTQAGN
jgi:hypothetical protein